MAYGQQKTSEKNEYQQPISKSDTQNATKTISQKPLGLAALLLVAFSVLAFILSKNYSNWSFASLAAAVVFAQCFLEFYDGNKRPWNVALRISALVIGLILVAIR